LELIGEKASIIFDNNVLSLIGDKEETMNFDLQTACQKSYDNAIAHFIASLESGAPFETDRLDNLKTLQLVSDAYELAGL
jgi:predicted dehydrogenase